MLSSGNNASRGNTTFAPPDVPLLPQCLPLEPITLVNQKYTRSGEIRRVLGVPSGSISEDHPLGVGQFKPTPPVATEELKSFKDSVQNASKKARDRVKILRESIFKLDKYREVLNSKKRQRPDHLTSDRSSEVNLLKMGGQIFRKSHEHPAQKLEGKSKAVETGLKKRIRTSMLEAKPASLSKIQVDSRSGFNRNQQINVEKERDILKSSGVDAFQIEEKIRRLPAGGEGWDKKMKRKRSVGAVGNRAINSQQDMKRPMHPKPTGDTKFRSIDAYGFRSRSSPSASGLSNSEEFCEPDKSLSSKLLKSEQESVPSLRDHTTTILEERATAKGNHKVNINEENPAGSARGVMKGKVSRMTKTDSVTMIDSSNTHSSSGTLRGWEQRTSGNKVCPLGGAGCHKRSLSTDASSHHMAQWVGRRPHKISRMGRANLISRVSNNDESHVSSQGTSDSSSRIPLCGPSGSPLASSIDNYNPKFKLKVENASSPLGLSEGDELGGGEKRAKEQGADDGEVAENGVHKPGDSIWPLRKNKVLVGEETGEEMQDQGRRERFLSSTGSTVPPVREKVENLPTPKPPQTTRRGLDKNRSKSGRPPSKKLMDRKVSINSGHVLNSNPSDLTGELVNDREELLIAANSARNASSLACSGPFWKKVEGLFASVTPEDASYLKQKINFAEELTESLSHTFGDDYSALGVIMHEVPVETGERQERHSRTDKVPPLYQRVLSALIEEDGSEEVFHLSEGRNMSFQCTSEDSHCGSCNHLDVEPKDRDRMESEVESEIDILTQKHCLLDRFSCNRSASSNTNSNRSVSSSICNNNELWQADDGLSYSDAGIFSVICQNDVGLQHSSQLNVSAVSSFDCQYQELPLDDRLLLELHSIGLYPETMPTLAEGEEKINQDIMQLQASLYQQVGRMKNNLAKINKAIDCGRDLERRKMEKVAMNHLIEMAYRRRMACRVGNSSKSVVRKVPKPVALAFVKRTLARCQKFENTGRSCFSEPALQDVILSALPNNNNDCVGSRTVNKGDPRTSGAQQAINHSPEQSFFKDETKLSKVKKREVLLDDVVGSASSKATSVVGSTQLGGMKGKRNEREKDQNRDVLLSNTTCPSVGSFRSDRKSKPKPKQKANHLPTSGNGLPGRLAEATNLVRKPAGMLNSSMGLSREQGGLPSPGNVSQSLSKKEEEQVDLTSLQLNELDSLDLGVPSDLAGNQDLWLDFDVDGLQEHECIGLDIPMDDLADVCM